MKAFIPPKKNRFFIWIAETFWKPILKQLQNINEVVISDKDKEKLAELKNHRLLFLSNHPTTAEPPLTFLIGKLIGDPLYFMASRQVFNWNLKIIGFFIRRMCGFSVIAGTSDRHSIKTARSILAQPAGKLAIYPEGEPTSGENDNLMPFQSGVAQLGFWGLEDARRGDPTADITVLYAFMRYVFNVPNEEIRENLDKSIRKLEKSLKIDSGERTLLHRFFTIGRVLLEQAEEEYGLEVRNKDFDYRMGRLRHHMLDNVADTLGYEHYDREADAIAKWRQLFALVEMLQLNYPDQSLPKVKRKTVKWAYWECIRAFDFIVMERDYILSNPTAERVYEWLDRYESYQFGKKPRAIGGVPSKLPRKAYIFFGETYKISDFYPTSKKERRQNVVKFTQKMREDLQELLDETKELSHPLFSQSEIKETIAKLK